jgi:hypothetical protein
MIQRSNGGNLGGVMSNHQWKFVAGFSPIGNASWNTKVTSEWNVIFDTFSANINTTRFPLVLPNLEGATSAIKNTMSEVLCGVCNAEPKKYKCPTCALP